MTIGVNGQWTGEKTRKIFYSLASYGQDMDCNEIVVWCWSLVNQKTTTIQNEMMANLLISYNTILNESS